VIVPERRVDQGEVIHQYDAIPSDAVSIDGYVACRRRDTACAPKLTSLPEDVNVTSPEVALTAEFITRSSPKLESLSPATKVMEPAPTALTPGCPATSVRVPFCSLHLYCRGGFQYPVNIESTADVVSTIFISPEVEFTASRVSMLSPERQIRRCCHTGYCRYCGDRAYGIGVNICVRYLRRLSRRLRRLYADCAGCSISGK